MHGPEEGIEGKAPADHAAADADKAELAKLRERLETLHATGETLAGEHRFILNNMRDFVYRHDIDGVFLYLSSAVNNITGYTVEQWKKHYTAYMTDHPVNDCAIKLTEATLQHGRVNPPYRVQIRHADGSLIMLEVSERPYFQAGKVAGIIGVARDISERLRAEEKRLELEAQMQQTQKLESLGLLAGGIAHDFNNLLMAVLGNADLLLHRLDAASSHRAQVEEIRLAAQCAADLCRQMLAYSGRGRFEVRPLRMSAFIHEMAEMLRVSISKKARLDLQLDDDPVIDADPTQIRQVVLNLVINASEALGGEMGSITVRTGTYRPSLPVPRVPDSDQKLAPGAYASLEVVDTGCGFGEDIRRHLFDPFFTTKFTGRGLGMSVVLGIVRGHGGGIQVDSEEGRGTSMRVLFPISSSQPQPQAERPAGSSSCSLPHTTVLLVDDEEIVRRVTGQMLRHIGVEVLQARHGREALELLADRPGAVDCVLLDLTMPEMSGAECLAELRVLYPSLPVILSSGYGQDELLRQTAQDELASSLRKPFDIKTLRTALQRALKVGEREARQDRSE